MGRVLPGVIAALGTVLVVAGVAVFALANGAGAPGDHGWSSSAPLERGPYQSSLTLTFPDEWAVLWTGSHVAGAGLLVSGLLVPAGLVGWVLGRRTAQRPVAPPD